MPDDQIRLPIKIVIPHPDEIHSRPPGGNNERKVFGDASIEYRRSLCEQVSHVRHQFEVALREQNIPAVARIVLKDKALAKSHRPHHLFTRNTCPIIGGEGFGHLLVSVRSQGLDSLEATIAGDTTDDIIADVSTIERIVPYTADDALRGLTRFLTENQSWDLLSPLKLRLFRHRDNRDDVEILSYFRNILQSIGLDEPKELKYVNGLRLYKLYVSSKDQLLQLAAFIGTQSIQFLPQYRLIDQSIPCGKAAITAFPPPDPQREYPIVGVIDSGTSSSEPLLRAWVHIKDEEDVPAEDQDNNHGSFVAGLIANARSLNHLDIRFPNAQAKILDVVAVPKDGVLYEDELLEIIQRAVAKYRYVKVWNLSLSIPAKICQDSAFSDLAMALDRIQTEYDVTFVISAGNYTSPPLRGWPAEDVGEADRISSPADSVHAITVGSLAHSENAATVVNVGQPSPFSRRGPGAGHLPKPEVCHYGGNCDRDLNYSQVGILSLDGQGNIAESIGTSFSTPLVSTILANIQMGVSEQISKNLARALLIHSSALSSGQVTAEELRYRGFGIPGDISQILTCAPWQATLIFEPELLPHRKIFEKINFPIPACFRNGKGQISGEIVMTLVYDPPLEPSAGAEYCCANIDVSLGTYDIEKDGKRHHHGQVPLEPADIDARYEKNLVEYGFKWSPVKVFRRRMLRVSGKQWRVRMELLFRDNVQIEKPQRAALVVTLLDPEQKKPVYDEVVLAMRNYGWMTQDLRVNERVRMR